MKSQSQHELDDLDRKILRYLQKDGKASLRTIAKIVDASVSAVKNHYDRLLEEGIIRDFIAVVDCCKVGYNEMLLFHIRINTSVPIEEIFNGLKGISQINAIYQVSGNYPIFCMAKCVEKRDQIRLLETIKQIKGIEEITTQVVLQRVKEDMRVLIP